jgi:integrase
MLPCKFRHTYCTRLLERGTDIVTVQKLMGHSDIKTTMRYVNPRDELKHSAARRLSLRTSRHEDAPRRGPGSERGLDDEDGQKSA